MLTCTEHSPNNTIYSAVMDTILHLIPADAVYLAGARYTACNSSSIFYPSRKEEKERLAFLYLVIIAKLADKAPYEWQDRIESHCKKIIPCTTIVLSSETFQHWIQQGHPFSFHVIKHGICLQQSAEFQIPELVSPPPMLSTSTSMLAEGFNMYKEFMAAASLFTLRKQNRFACFMLHQAIELGLHSILKAGIGFHYRTHNIERLIIYASLVHEELFYWMYGADKDNKLLHKLQQAYSGARYEESYAVSNCELTEITALVQQLNPYFLKEKRVLME